MTTVGGINIRLTADSSDFNREMRVAEARAKSTGSAIRTDFAKTEAMADRTSKSIRNISSSMLALSAGAALGIGAGIGVISEFSAAMSTVEAVTGATKAQMVALTAEARRLGATTKFSATQAAEGMIFLARAGFSANEALAATESTLRLAQAGNLELGRAADIASNVLGGFNLNVAETGRVVDVLAKAANSSNTDINQLGEALKFAAPTANALNLTLEETVAIIGKLGDSGLQGGLAGRGFQSFATAFVSKKDEIKALIGDFDLAEEGLTNLIRRLKEAGITTNQVLQIFRAENLDVFQVLANAAFDSEKGIDALKKKLDEARGTAANVSKIMGQNLKGAILETNSAMQELVLSLAAAGAESTLTASFQGLTQLFRVAAENADLLAVAAVALAIRGLLPLAAKAVPAVLTSLRYMRLELALVETATAKAGVAMGFLGGPVTLAIAAAATAFVFLARDAQKAADRIADAKAAIDGAKASLQAFDAIIANNGPFQKIVEDANLAEKAINSITDATDALSKAIKDATNDTRLTALLDLSKQIGNVREQIAILESERAKAERRSREYSVRDGRQIAPNALKNFDESEAGKSLRQLRQLEAALQSRAEGLSENLFANDNFDDMVAQQQKVAEITKEVERLRADGLDKAANKLSEQLEMEKEILGYLQDGYSLELAKKVAQDNRGTPLDEDTAKKLADQKLVQEGLKLERELAIAIAGEKKDDITRLEREIELRGIILDLIDAGYSAADAQATAEQFLADRDKATAEAKAAAAEAALREFEASQRRDIFALNTEADKKKKEELEAARQEFRDTFAGAVEEAMRTGNVGDAIKSVFADRVAEGMRDALDDLADAIFDLFSQVFKNMNGSGSSGGGGFGGFLGSVIGGGISSLFGITGLNSGPASQGISLGKLGGSNAAPISITIQGDANEKTIAIMEQKLAQHRAALPSAIDSRVSESIKRGRY